MADATDLKSVDRKVVWVRLPPSAPLIVLRFSRFPPTSPLQRLSPKMPDGAKMGAPLTRLPFELDHIASRLCESVHGFFQSLWSAASVSARHGLNVVT
jgi:hypothetical protein